MFSYCSKLSNARLFAPVRGLHPICQLSCLTICIVFPCVLRTYRPMGIAARVLCALVAMGTAEGCRHESSSISWCGPVIEQPYLCERCPGTKEAEAVGWCQRYDAKHSFSKHRTFILIWICVMQVPNQEPNAACVRLCQAT